MSTQQSEGSVLTIVVRDSRGHVVSNTTVQSRPSFGVQTSLR